MTTIDKLIKETMESETDQLGNRISYLDTEHGKITCYIHSVGSHVSGDCWERTDFYLTTETSHGKISKAELGKII